MAVEKILDRGIQVKDLEIENTSQPDARQLYNNLKYSSLYDTKKEQWITGISCDTEWGSSRPLFSDKDFRSTRTTSAQLVGVIAERVFYKESALRQYEALKNSAHYNKNEKQWIGSIHEDKTPGDSSGYAFDQLLGVLAEGLFDKEEGYKQFEEVKETDLYDKEKKQWNWYVKEEDQVLRSDDRYSNDQLLGIFIVALFDKEEAWQQYTDLKNTDLFDKQTNQWNESIKKNQELFWTERHSTDQLLGVLVEGLFNKTKARMQYEELKKTDLFNYQKKQWNESIKKNQELSDPTMYAMNQLLGVLCERMFEVEDLFGGEQFEEKQNPLPMVRRF